MADWKPEARGIPVWDGAFIVTPAGNVDGPVEKIDGTTLILRGGSTQYPAAFCGLALSHADTCAAFLRRLAIRLGCPEEVAGEGVAFSKRRYAWVVYAGWSVATWEWAWAMGCTFKPEDQTGNRTVALVRAWRGVGEQPKEQA